MSYKAIDLRFVLSEDAPDLLSKIITDDCSLLNTFKVGYLRDRYIAMVRDLAVLERTTKQVYSMKHFYLDMYHKLDFNRYRRCAIEPEVFRQTPYELKNQFDELYTYEKPVVIGFNHPSFGEFPRILEFCFDRFTSKRILMSVSLPAYEALARYDAFLRNLKVELVPLLTDSNFQEIKQNLPGMANFAHDLRNKLAYYFYTRCQRYNEDGHLILVPVSDNIRNSVYPEEVRDQGDYFRPRIVPILNTMPEDVDGFFIPLAVDLPAKKSNSLDLLNPRRIAFGRTFRAENLRRMLSESGPNITEFQFHQQIALAMHNELKIHHL